MGWLRTKMIWSKKGYDSKLLWFLISYDKIYDDSKISWPFKKKYYGPKLAMNQKLNFVENVIIINL